MSMTPAGRVLTQRLARKRVLRIANRWASQIADPVRIAQVPTGYYRYLRDWMSYRRLPNAERLRIVDSHPEIHDRTATTHIDSHYFYANAWAMRRIANRPSLHVDIASHHMLVGLMAAVVPVVFVDYRPLRAPLHSLHSLAANALQLPFADSSVTSVSCIHAAEHIGLGRYGDPLDVQGTQKGCKELSRILSPGGFLVFALPVGRHRTCFNAHRVHDPTVIRDYFGDLRLLSFSYVDDYGCFFENAELDQAEGSEYACGLYEFQKK